MTGPTLDELLRTWTRRAAGERALSSPALEQAILQSLADGRAATPAEIARATGASPDHVRDQIDAAASLGCEVQDDAIVGAALTLLPTGHRFRVRGNDLFTWCGFDAMFLPIMLQERAWVTTTCPVTGLGIH